MPSNNATISGLMSHNMTSEDDLAARNQNYWNLDDILAEEELVPVVFKTQAKNLGELQSLA
jgi:hypothetical protein